MLNFGCSILVQDLSILRTYVTITNRTFLYVSFIKLYAFNLYNSYKIKSD